MKTILRWSSVLRQQFGERVQKVTLDIGAGCPNRDGLTSGGCIFCDERGGGDGSFLKGVPLKEQIARGVRGAQKHYKTRSVILYFQSYSATNLPLERFCTALEEALKCAQDLGARVCGIAVGTRPDLLPQSVLDYLDHCSKQYQVWFELGVQTIDEQGLAWLNRRHGLDAVEDAVKRLAQTRLRVCAHLISGLPNEDDEQLKRSALWLVSHGFHALKFHPLHVLKGTVLEKYYEAGQFVPLTKEQYLNRLILALAALPENVIIQRLCAGARPPRLVAPSWVLDKESFEREADKRLAAYWKNLVP